MAELRVCIVQLFE